MVGRIQGRDGRGRVGRDGLHPHRFRVSHHIDVMDTPVPPPHPHPSTRSPDMPYCAQHVSWSGVSGARMAGSRKVGTVSIPAAFGSAIGSTQMSTPSLAGHDQARARSDHPFRSSMRCVYHAHSIPACKQWCEGRGWGSADGLREPNNEQKPREKIRAQSEWAGNGPAVIGYQYKAPANNTQVSSVMYTTR